MCQLASCCHVLLCSPLLARRFLVLLRIDFSWSRWSQEAILDCCPIPFGQHRRIIYCFSAAWRLDNSCTLGFRYRKYKKGKSQQTCSFSFLYKSSTFPSKDISMVQRQQKMAEWDMSHSQQMTSLLFNLLWERCPPSERKREILGMIQGCWPPILGDAACRPWSGRIGARAITARTRAALAGLGSRSIKCVTFSSTPWRHWSAPGHIFAQAFGGHARENMNALRYLMAISSIKAEKFIVPRGTEAAARRSLS